MNDKIIAKGIDKLSEPFKDSLSQYKRGRQSTLERTWDDIQIQVMIAISIFVYKYKIHTIQCYVISCIVVG